MLKESCYPHYDNIYHSFTDNFRLESEDSCSCKCFEFDMLKFDFLFKLDIYCMKSITRRMISIAFLLSPCKKEMAYF